MDIFITRTVKHGGKLQLDDNIPYTAQMIATITRTQVGTVERALQIFLQLGLVELLTDGAYYMYEENGQPLEKVLANILRVCFFRPKRRPYRTNNFYAVIARQDRLDKEVHRIVYGNQKLASPPVRKRRRGKPKADSRAGRQ